jgi:hypothetical protein
VLQANASHPSSKGGAAVHITVSLMSTRLGVSYDEVARACWNLQKEGLLRFSEDKKGSKTYLQRFWLTEKGLATKPDVLALKDHFEPNRNNAGHQYLNGMFEEPGHGVVTQPTLSPIARTKQADNVIKPFGGTHRRHFTDPTEPSAHGSVAQGGEVTVTHIADVPASSGIPMDAPLPPTVALRDAAKTSEAYLMDGLTLIPDLLAREVKRKAAAEAVDALIKAGLESLAEQALVAIPDDTPFEREVITLVGRLGLTR